MLQVFFEALRLVACKDFKRLLRKADKYCR